MRKSIKKSIIISISIVVLSFVPFSTLFAEDGHSDGILSSSDVVLISKGTGDRVSNTKVSGARNSAGVITYSDFEFISKPYSATLKNSTLAKVDTGNGIVSAADSSFSEN